jgi:hypothetical protein
VLLSIHGGIVSTVSFYVSSAGSPSSAGFLSLYSMHFSCLLLLVGKAMCRGEDKHYLNYQNFSPWHSCSQFINLFLVGSE